ncbi:HAD family phosphatase [Ammonicoccus fulvus]|uniref:HAD family phosphatase n=1 Tax=Ammonicoccus fulvus TaxID=3138240 RepID=A0ABZ3FNF4_9ACTN
MNEYPSPTPELPAAVLWDFDGTLVDTEPIWFASEYALADELGGTWNDYLAHELVGSSLIETARTLIRRAGRDDLDPVAVTERLVDLVVARLELADLEWRPGAVELLTELAGAGVPCALVSASFQRVLDTALHRLPVNPFDVIIAGDDVTHGKPHPEPYLTAAARLGVRPEDCLVLEDSINGADSGTAAGCVVAVIPNAVQPPAAERRFHLDTLAGVGLDRLRALMAAELVR